MILQSTLRPPPKRVRLMSAVLECLFDADYVGRTADEIADQLAEWHRASRADSRRALGELVIDGSVCDSRSRRFNAAGDAEIVWVMINRHC
jgi:hypothetical protein